MSEIFWVPFMMGLLGFGHCLAMCGSISTALCMSSDSNRRFTFNVFYNAGRISSYCCLGFFLGLVGQAIPAKPVVPILHYLSSFLIIALGFYLAGLPQLLLPLERFGQIIWVQLQKFAKTLLPVESIAAAWLAGVVWGWLPCGLVYAAAAYALTREQALEGGMVMLAFGLGTLPALLFSGSMGVRLMGLIRSKHFRVVCGGVLVVYGLWALVFGGHHGHSEHDNLQKHHIDPGHSHHH